MTESRTFDVAVLCSANRFRSPLTAELVRRCAPAGVQVASAATAKRARGRALPEARELALVHGVDLERHEARALAGAALTGAALVIGFESAHVDAATTIGGAPPERTFTLPELVNLLEQMNESRLARTPLERAREAVSLAHELRLARPELTEAVPELDDPVGHPHIVFVELAATLDRLVRHLCRQLFGA